MGYLLLFYLLIQRPNGTSELRPIKDEVYQFETLDECEQTAKHPSVLDSYRELYGESVVARCEPARGRGWSLEMKKTGAGPVP